MTVQPHPPGLHENLLVPPNLLIVCRGGRLLESPLPPILVVEVEEPRRRGQKKAFNVFLLDFCIA